MDIVKRLRHTEEHTATIGQKLVYLQVPVNPDGPEAADEIERLRRDVIEANARAYVMAKEATLWQSRAAFKESE
jgi:hypothetical protein